jgi:VanZ family protein
VILRLFAWVLLFLIAAFSVISPYYRVVTFVPHAVEHFGIFLLVGLAVGLGYPSRYMTQSLFLLVTVAIELAQLWAPGRHARFSDLLVNSMGLGVGIALTYVVTSSRQRCIARPLTKIMVACKRAFPT